MKPVSKIGQRWMLVNYDGEDKYLVAEVSSLDGGEFTYVRVVQTITNNSRWKFLCIMHERLQFNNHWQYLEGQDNV